MKVRSILSTTGLAIILACGAGAQTNVVPANDADFIKTPDSLRVVNGQLYNLNDTEHPEASWKYLWESMSGEILKVSTNRMVISTFTMEPIYQAATGRDFNFRGTVLVPQLILVGKKKVPGKKFILRNYPENLSPTVGQTIQCLAMRVGTSDHDGDTLEMWDYGTKPSQEELRRLRDKEAERQKAVARKMVEQRRAAAEKAAATKKATQDKLFKWHLEQAEKGDSFGLFRMGEHCRDGDGVPKDLGKAREYFAKAVNAGSPTAADALSKLNQLSTNSPAGQ